MSDRLSDYPYTIVRLRCDACTREGSYKLVRLAAKYGADIFLDMLLKELTVDCRYHDAGRSRRRRGAGCTAYFVDLIGPPRPPDLPPSIGGGLRVIDGGRMSAPSPLIYEKKS